MSNPHESKCCGVTDRKCPNNKTLCVKQLAGELKRDEIMGICPFVEYTQAESVAKALESDIHSIAERSVEIDDTDDDSETTFLDLNDDCIHGILSTKCLSALDLCSVAETHLRLKDIAFRFFRRKHANCDVVSLARELAIPSQRILRNFGAVISDLEIRGWHFQDNGSSVLKSVIRHCSSTLKSLHLTNCVIRDNFPAKLKPIFNNLQKLKIDDCTFEGASQELFAHCGSLVELELIGEDFSLNSSFTVGNTFPKLQTFKCCSVAVDGMNLDSFISRHKNLTSITIWDSTEMSSLLPTIAKNCKQLEKLHFIIKKDQRFDLSSLGNLRKLYITCWRQNDMKAVRGWNNLQFLEQLTLRWANVDGEFIKTLSQLKRLQVLRLFHCDGFEIWNRIGDLNQLTELEIYSDESVNLDFVALLKGLSKLQALSVETDDFKYKIDLETYLRIVDVVRERPDKSKLTFKLVNLGWRQRYEADMLNIFSLHAEIVKMIT